MALSKEHIFGFDFINDHGYDNILKAVLLWEYKKGAALPFFITPNVDQIVKFEQEEYSSLKAFLSQSAFILPDGQPIVWSSKLLGKSLSSRLTGADFFKESFLAFEPYYKKCLFVVSSEILASKLNNSTGSAGLATPAATGLLYSSIMELGLPFCENNAKPTSSIPG